MQKEPDGQVKILIVDDDKVVADILKDLTDEGSNTVCVCYDGLAAIERLQKEAYDIVVVDLIMPKVSGIDVLRYAKKVNPDVIVIIITGYASLETAITAVREGAYDYIRKPCKLEEIKIVVDNAIDKIRLNRENGELLKKLQEAYHELMVLKEKKGDDGKRESINFFSSDIPNLHYLYRTDPSANNYVEKLQALSSLKENGLLTDGEFRSFKKHLLALISHQE